MHDEWAYVYDVELAEEEHGRVSVSLVRMRERYSKHRLRSRSETLERTVLFARSFLPIRESIAQERYAAQLALIARHSQEGTFGCFAETRPDGPNVEVVLWERWFDGTGIRTEELARQAFSASDEQSLVASAEFLADLRTWADRRNEEREAAYLIERCADDERRQLESQEEAASRELSEILASHAR